MPTTPYVIPLVHLNGTSKNELLEYRGVAYSALNSAYHALKLTSPNGRDYYCHPTSNALNLATEQHVRRLASVEKLMKEIEFEMECIDNDIHTSVTPTIEQKGTRS